MAADYPYYTPYQFAGNTPIQAVDLDGGEPKRDTVGQALKAASDAAHNALNNANTVAKLTGDKKLQMDIGVSRWFVNGLTTLSLALGARPDVPSKPLIKMSSRGCAAPVSKQELRRHAQNRKRRPTSWLR